MRLRRRKKLNVKPKTHYCTNCGNELAATRDSQYDPLTGDEVSVEYSYRCYKGCLARHIKLLQSPSTDPFELQD